MKLDKSADETLAILQLTYGEHVVKNLNVFESYRESRKSVKMCKRQSKNIREIC